MPRAARKESITNPSKNDNSYLNEKISTTSISNIQPASNNQSWDGLLNAQGLPALPFAAIPPSVDMNLVMALAQIMTMNALKAISQNQSMSQNNPQSEKEKKKELMLTLQEKLKNRKSHPPPPAVKKKKTKKTQKASPSDSPSNLSNLELLALATAAHSSPETASYSADTTSSRGLLTALQAGFPNIDWNKLESVPSPTTEAIKSVFTNVSES